MYRLEKLHKNTYSFLLIFALLFWELLFYPASVAEDLSYFGIKNCQTEDQDIELEDTYITSTAMVVQEAGIPEIVSSYSHIVSVTHILTGRTFRGKNALGRFWSAFFVLIVLSGGCARRGKYGFFENLADPNLDLFITFIHDQDGKKKSTRIVK
ncbi:MAG: hypothetical protein IJ794_04085 [Lachnospiraceae bacterium]|nr:hypothetical protein [Lachnospiraceae bacterium]